MSSKVKSKKIKKGLGDCIFSTIIYTALILFGIVALYPFLHVIAVSLSSSKFVSSGLVSIIPKGFNIKAYMEVFNNDMILVGYKNTLIVTVFTTVLGVICTAMTAYPL